MYNMSKDIIPATESQTIWLTESVVTAINNLPCPEGFKIAIRFFLSRKGFKPVDNTEEAVKDLEKCAPLLTGVKVPLKETGVPNVYEHGPMGLLIVISTYHSPIFLYFRPEVSKGFARVLINGGQTIGEMEIATLDDLKKFWRSWLTEWIIVLKNFQYVLTQKLPERLAIRDLRFIHLEHGDWSVGFQFKSGTASYRVHLSFGILGLWKNEQFQPYKNHETSKKSYGYGPMMDMIYRSICEDHGYDFDALYGLLALVAITA